MPLLAELRRRNVIRVAAGYLVVGWLLTEVLTTILPEIGAPGWTSRAVILIFAFGFIPAVVLSWFFEITPDGIKREHEVDREQPGTNRVARRVDQVTIATAIVLIIVIGLFSARYTADDPSAIDLGISATSIAVLPFDNMSGDKDNEYFSDGLTETILHMLAQVPDLQVAARTSSFAFKGQNMSIRDIAAALEVAHVLEGSVQRAGDQIRVTAQLIRASDGIHIWSKNFDRTFNDVFKIQDEIAMEVGSALSASLLGTDPQNRPASITTEDFDAYELYLQARKERATYSYAGLLAAEDLLKGALLIDPDFIEAKSELANSYVHQAETGLMHVAEANAEIIAITDQVLAVDPDDPVAKATSLYAKAMSLVVMGDDAAMTDLAAELETIVNSAPTVHEPRILLVRAYTALRQNEKCVPLLQGALTLDKFNPALHYELGTAYIRLERWDEAKAALEKSLALEPMQPNAYTYLGMIAMQSGDYSTVVKHQLNAISVDPEDHELPGLLALFLYRVGLIDIADDFRERVLTLAPTSTVAYQIELVRAKAIGDMDGSIEAARRAIEDDIDERRFSYAGAVQHLVRSAVMTGRVEEEMAWIEEQQPGIFDVDATIVPMKYRNAQGTAFDGWVHTLPHDELMRRLDVLIAFTESMGNDPTDNAATHVGILTLRGEIEEAIDVALKELFSQSVALNPDWRDMLLQPQYAEIVADPRVQEAMRRWEEEEVDLRASVETYFADFQAAM
ncbi:MAG: tetratricopeptide repeat protein [Gammaproteobacteria bacterium]|nr:tetratricopeptide repeat protein [Gammaproteobacteria bacterium]